MLLALTMLTFLPNYLVAKDSLIMAKLAVLSLITFYNDNYKLKYYKQVCLSMPTTGLTFCG
jgi:hypothetical protein